MERVVDVKLLVQKIEKFIKEQDGSMSFNELDSEPLILEKEEKDEEWMIETLNYNDVTIVKYVHEQEVAENEVKYKDLPKDTLEEIVEIIDDYEQDYAKGGKVEFNGWWDDSEESDRKKDEYSKKYNLKKGTKLYPKDDKNWKVNYGKTPYAIIEQFGLKTPNRITLKIGRTNKIISLEDIINNWKVVEYAKGGKTPFVGYLEKAEDGENFQHILEKKGMFEQVGGQYIRTAPEDEVKEFYEDRFEADTSGHKSRYAKGGEISEAKLKKMLKDDDVS